METFMSDTRFIVIAYCIYLPLTIGLTWYVARVLFNSGKVFMLDIFRGREDIAFATNHLFRVGFYLLNIGYAMLVLRTDRVVDDGKAFVELLSWKIGGFSIYLGIMLFFNLYLFFRGKKKSKENHAAQQMKEILPPRA